MMVIVDSVDETDARTDGTGWQASPAPSHQGSCGMVTAWSCDASMLAEREFTMSIRTLQAGLVLAASLWAMPVVNADWPTVHGNAERNGFTTDCVRGPYRLDWVAEFPNEI